MHGISHMRVWIVAAHPDDETIGASALLGCRDEVIVVHVTDGAPRDSRWWPRGVVDRGAYLRERARESGRALSLAGAERVALGFHDQEAMFAVRELIAAFAELARRARPDVIVTHAYEGGHPDHDTAAFAVARLRDWHLPDVPVFEMAIYHGGTGALRAGEFLGEDPGRCYRLDPVQRLRRTRMLAMYRSQATTLEPFRGLDHECYRPAPDHEFARPPHAGPLLYERWGMASGEHWRAIIADIDGTTAHTFRDRRSGLVHALHQPRTW